MLVAVFCLRTKRSGPPAHCRNNDGVLRAANPGYPEIEIALASLFE